MFKFSNVFRVLCSFPLVVAAATEPAPESAQGWPEVRDETFSLVWETVNTAYFDPTFGGVDWGRVRERYAARLPAIADKPGLRRLLGEMLGELGKTHFGILPREAAVFSAAERPRIGTVGGEVGIVEGAVAIVRLSDASAAKRAGLKVGDRIATIQGLDLEAAVRNFREAGVSATRWGAYLSYRVNAQLCAPVGTVVKLEVRDPEGEVREVAVTSEKFDGEWSAPMGDFPSQPLDFEAVRSDGGIAYLRFNLFALELMKPIRTFLASLQADDGLVIDLRGNPGGLSTMAAGIGGWLMDRRVRLGVMRLREGMLTFEVFPQKRAFAGPVAILMDCSSASTSEILTAGLQEVGRGRVFGEKSAGAALPSLFKVLPSGDMLQYAIADLQTARGRMLEGNGVPPDEPVAATIADLSAGRDKVREAAEDWLARLRKARAELP